MENNDYDDGGNIDDDDGDNIDDKCWQKMMMMMMDRKVLSVTTVLKHRFFIKDKTRQDKPDKNREDKEIQDKTRNSQAVIQYVIFNAWSCY